MSTPGAQVQDSVRGESVVPQEERLEGTLDQEARKFSYTEPEGERGREPMEPSNALARLATAGTGGSMEATDAYASTDGMPEVIASGNTHK